MVETEWIGKSVEGEGADLGGIVSGSRGSARPADKDSGNRMMTGISLGIGIGVELPQPIDIETGLLSDLAPAGCLEGFADLDESTRKSPSQRFEAPAHEKHIAWRSFDDRIHRAGWVRQLADGFSAVRARDVHRLEISLGCFAENLCHLEGGMENDPLALDRLPPSLLAIDQRHCQNRNSGLVEKRHVDLILAVHPP